MRSAVDLRIEYIWLGVRSRMMLKKSWKFIKDNVAAIITVATAILTVVYAVLRLCMFVYWKGYFTRLNIDVNLMNLNFDKSIFAVIFISVILFIVIFFMVWVFEIINDIKQKEKEKSLKGIKKIFNWIIAFGKGLGVSFVILSVVNVPLLMLLISVTGIDITMSNKMFLFVLLYIAEMLFIFTQKTTIEQHEKTAEKDIVIKVIEILAFVLITLAALFYEGNQAIDKKTSVQLVENEEYMISYCDGDCYVLHKVDYIDGKIIVYRNEQKVISTVNCEVSIKQISEISIKE